MKAKSEVAVYVIRDGADTQSRSRELTARCLQHHFGFEPEVLRTESGKPYFANPVSGSFSLSHSKDVFVLAVCGEGEIGVDVELPVDGKDYSRLAKKYCAESKGSDEFFRVWTAKEACCKLTGAGLSGMGKVKVDFQTYRADVEDCGQVFLYDLSSAVGAPCTLAANKEVTWKVNDL